MEYKDTKKKGASMDSWNLGGFTLLQIYPYPDYTTVLMKNGVPIQTFKDHITAQQMMEVYQRNERQAYNLMASAVDGWKDISIEHGKTQQEHYKRANVDLHWR